MSQIPIGWLIDDEGFVYPFNKRPMMVDGIPVTGPKLFLPKGHYWIEPRKIMIVPSNMVIYP